MPENLPAATGGLPALSAEDLALMEEGAMNGGVEQFNMRQRIVPYLSIVQGTSGVVKRSDPRFVEGAVEGDLIDNLMMKPMRNALVIPCKFEEHYTEWEHVARGRGKMIKQWFTDDSKYLASEGGNPGMPRRTPDGNDIVVSPTYYCLLVDQNSWTGRPLVLPLQSTQARKSRRWNSQIDTLVYQGPHGPANAPIYAMAYMITTVPESNNDNTWMGFRIEPFKLTLGLNNGRALWKQAQEVRAAVERHEMRMAPPVREVSDEQPRRDPPPRSNEPPPRGDDDIPF